jgi:hypothetical protein
VFKSNFQVYTLCLSLSQLPCQSSYDDEHDDGDDDDDDEHDDDDNDDVYR